MEGEELMAVGGRSRRETPDPADPLAPDPDPDLDPNPDPVDPVRQAALRRLGLLWDPPESPARGRRAGLTLSQVVAAGVEVARESGFAELSMRKVAARLGVGAMSLYTYVEGKDKLVELMLDRVFAEVPVPPPGGTWRERLSRHARSLWELYLRHPWVLHTSSWRRPLGPHVLDVEEAGLSALADTGLDERRVVQVLGVLDAFLQGLARAAVNDAQVADATAQTAEQHWASLADFWSVYFDPRRYPTMVRIWEAGGYSVSGDVLETNLEPLLDGIELTIEAARAQAPDGGAAVPPSDAWAGRGTALP